MNKDMYYTACTAPHYRNDTNNASIVYLMNDLDKAVDRIDEHMNVETVQNVRYDYEEICEYLGIDESQQRHELFESSDENDGPSDACYEHVRDILARVVRKLFAPGWDEWNFGLADTDADMVNVDRRPLVVVGGMSMGDEPAAGYTIVSLFNEMSLFDEPFTKEA